MGKIWRFTMVLLSTLAALVIIVHSAEEEYEAQYRRELRRPRIPDTSPRTYEQPWRTMDLEPVMQSTPEDTWMDSSEEPPRRRRPGRKRKRRPELSSAEDSIPMDRYGFAEEPVRPYFDVDSTVDHKLSDTPKRRRRKQEPRPERWDSPVEEDRPIKRRGQRRKRPSLDNWPQFSEFNGYRPNEAPREMEEQEHVTTSPIDQVSVNEDYRRFDDSDNIHTRFTVSETIRHPLIEDAEIKPNSDHDETNVKYTDDRKHESNKRSETDYRYSNAQRSRATEDISLSEFSLEDLDSVVAFKTKEENKNMKNKIMDKSLGFLNELSKSQNEGPIDALTLKDILKRSNGTSLSEILQQHNLSLTDLLHGKEQVLSILKSEDSLTPPYLVDSNTEEKTSSEEKLTFNTEIKYVLDSSSENPTTQPVTKTIEIKSVPLLPVEVESSSKENNKVENASKRLKINRFPTAMRRNQRIRPMMNTTYKSQVSRDMLALNARKYFNNRRRNSTHEWKDLIPMMKKNISSLDSVNKKTEIETTTLNTLIEETTMSQDIENCTSTGDLETETNITDDNANDIRVTPQRNKSNIEKVFDVVQNSVNVTDTPIAVQITTQALNASGLRRQAFNNRLKKKRIKHKNLTTEPPQDDVVRNLFGIPNLVSSSEFISQTKGPTSNLDDVTILEDFITTESPHKHENRPKIIRYTSPRTSTTPQFVYIPSSTEETAKIEIEEIFNDSQTSARLSKILKDRNMTLSELVEHRERGSSHVHLADIFHNASKEPNPPEPFLSKSLIEPISKETYPLRALLDANNHDTTAKATTIDPVTVTVPTTEVNIPVIMNFGNNVNENAENMGIMSLFHNITKNETGIDKTTLKKDSQGTLYETSITVVNTTDVQNDNDTVRESRVLHVIKDNHDDVVSWNEIFSLMRRNYENQTQELTKAQTNGVIPAEKIRIPSLEEDLDGDGLIVLEDIQPLKDFDTNIASVSSENIDFNSYERAESPITTKAPDSLNKMPNQTKSVTVATASIAGLAMVLFLLTYVGYRWQQQRAMARKKSFSEERVPTPVFENRKGHKNNSSSRSISPMLTSNIYTLNTLDSRNGNESPDYMWDSLRKPFQ